MHQLERSCISKFLWNQGFVPFKADNNVWLRPAEEADGFKHYECVLVYTDDILCVSMNASAILDEMNQEFLLKKNSTGELKQYLGASVKKFQKADGT